MGSCTNSMCIGMEVSASGSPSYANRVVQDEATKIFSAQVWTPAKPYHFKKENFKPQRSPLLIYECHIGMAQDAEKVGDLQ